MNKIRIMLYALIAMLTTTITACSDDDDNNTFASLPMEVQKAFSEKYPGSRVSDWKKKDVYYIIDFNIGKKEAEAWFESNVWRMTEKDADFVSLPDSVSKAFKSGKYAQWNIDDVDIVERNGFPTMYVIEVEKGKTEVDLYYFEDGTLLKEVADNDENNGYLPQIPTKVNEILSEMYPGAYILDAEFEKGLYEVEIMHEKVKKEVVFDRNFAWVFSKWEILSKDLPQEVLSFIEMNYKDYEVDDIEMITSADKGVYYEIELEKNGSEVEIKVSSKGELIK